MLRATACLGILLLLLNRFTWRFTIHALLSLARTLRGPLSGAPSTLALTESLDASPLPAALRFFSLVLDAFGALAVLFVFHNTIDSLMNCVQRLGRVAWERGGDGAVRAVREAVA